MLLALVLYRYVCVLICTENAYHANTRRHRQEGGGSPTDSRSGPHRFKRWPPLRVWCDTFAPCGTLLCVALSSIQDPPDASTIVEYILVIPTPGGMLCQTPV